MSRMNTRMGHWLADRGWFLTFCQYHLPRGDANPLALDDPTLTAITLKILFALRGYRV